MKKNYYEVLGIDSKSDKATIKEAYRALLLKIHPDRNSAPNAKEQTKLLLEIVSILLDPLQRASYDKSMLKVEWEDSPTVAQPKPAEPPARTAQPKQPESPPQEPSPVYQDMFTHRHVRPQPKLASIYIFKQTPRLIDLHQVIPPESFNEPLWIYRADRTHSSNLDTLQASISDTFKSDKSISISPIKHFKDHTSQKYDYIVITAPFPFPIALESHLKALQQKEMAEDLACSTQSMFMGNIHVKILENRDLVSPMERTLLESARIAVEKHIPSSRRFSRADLNQVVACLEDIKLLSDKARGLKLSNTANILNYCLENLTQLLKHLKYCEERDKITIEPAPATRSAARPSF